MGSTKDLEEAEKVGIGGDNVCALSASTREPKTSVLHLSSTIPSPIKVHRGSHEVSNSILGGRGYPYFASIWKLLPKQVSTKQCPNPNVCNGLWSWLRNVHRFRAAFYLPGSAFISKP